MIHPKAVKAFLRRKLDSHAWMKKLTHKELNEALREVGFVRSHELKLYKQQKVCVLLGLAFLRFAFWLDMGTGKTRIILELLNHWWRHGKAKRMVIVCISDEAVQEWEKQIETWNIKIPYVGVGNSSTPEKWRAVAELGAGIIICTYTSFNYMFSIREKLAVKRGRKKKKTRLVPNKKLIKNFAQNLDNLTLDESVHVGNYKSLGFRIAKQMTKHTNSVFALAGVPFGRDPTLVWAQQYLVDRGESLGDTLGMFRNAFYTEKPGYFTMFDYKFKKEMEEELARMMAHRSISYDESECGDLPKVTPIRRPIKLPPETYAYYEQALKTLKQARGNKQVVENTFLRMRQISSGFLGMPGDENGKRAEFVFPRNPKLDDLLNNIEDMPYDCKFVIFHEFTISGKLIMEGLAARGIKAGWIHGGVKNSRALRNAFDQQSPKKFKGLVLNWKKAAESLNLQRANYKHFFESPVGVIPRRQAEKRCFRGGQTRKGFMFDYVATTADARILDFQKEGKSFFDAVLRDPSLLEG